MLYELDFRHLSDDKEVPTVSPVFMGEHQRKESSQNDGANNLRWAVPIPTIEQIVLCALRYAHCSRELPSSLNKVEVGN